MERTPGGGVMKGFYKKMGKDFAHPNRYERTERNRSGGTRTGQDSDGRQRLNEMDLLERDFERSIVQLESSLGYLELREKSMATEWIQKLWAFQPNVTEAKARNAILTYLIMSIDDNVFKREPFNKSPPFGNLSGIQAVMPITQNTMCLEPPSENVKRRYIAELFKNCYDSGHFLSQLPVPRDGSFVIFHMRPNI
ncbi:uncharacterized protein LOC117895445 [Drosophila subobscura]|uniref:uncharacterized protein LOC117895445 n=1 Tax=Drosophila subobscura TaxID=7241 RepID=UPI00155B1B80|nr:uncharacterized protein LOC117895445 [Drosophila subobscura]